MTELFFNEYSSVKYSLDGCCTNDMLMWVPAINFIFCFNFNCQSCTMPTRKTLIVDDLDGSKNSGLVQHVAFKTF